MPVNYQHQGLSRVGIRRLIQLALEEDFGCGDVVSDLLFSRDQVSEAKIISRESLVVCGLPLILEILDVARSNVKCKILVQEGESVSANTTLAKLSGPTGEILTLERTILNFLQRLCGIALAAKQWVEAGKGMTILDTRKTLPGYRVLDKYATRIGGASNHRMNLGAMAMIKNNHIDAVRGGLTGIIKTVRANAPLATPIEVEVRNITELKQAIAVKPAVIMLDNMSDAEILKALKLLKQRRCESIIEVSGGVTKDRLPRLRKLGVHYVSVGSLTHSVRAADLSLRIS